MSIDYDRPGRLTDLSAVPPAALAPLPDDPVAICSAVQSLVLQPTDPAAAVLPEQRRAENQVRRADELLERLLALDPRPLDVARTPDTRVVGTCRHFAVLSCALLRHHGIAARARCGFATYFQPGKGVDHWIIEYRTDATHQWTRVDTEILGTSVVAHPHALQPVEFLTGGEAWQAHRQGRIDAATFGVYGTPNWGPAEISGNAMRDLAALNKLEMLPWDEWGRMTEAYDGRTGPDYDELVDTLAAVCAEDDPDAVAELYQHAELRVPGELVG